MSRLEISGWGFWRPIVLHLLDFLPWRGAAVTEGLSYVALRIKVTYKTYKQTPQTTVWDKFGGCLQTYNPSVSFADSSLYTREPGAARNLSFSCYAREPKIPNRGCLHRGAGATRKSQFQFWHKGVGAKKPSSQWAESFWKRAFDYRKSDFKLSQTKRKEPSHFKQKGSFRYCVC